MRLVRQRRARGPAHVPFWILIGYAVEAVSPLSEELERAGRAPAVTGATLIAAWPLAPAGADRPRAHVAGAAADPRRQAGRWRAQASRVRESVAHAAGARARAGPEPGSSIGTPLGRPRRVGPASGSTRSRRPGIGPRVVASRQPSTVPASRSGLASAGCRGGSSTAAAPPGVRDGAGGGAASVPGSLG